MNARTTEPARAGTKLRACLLLGLAAGAGALWPGCSPAERLSTLPDIRLPTLSGATGSSLASCPTAKCLTVYVAPWCGYCRRATPLIIELQRRLRKDAASMRVVVGMDSMDAVRQYARDFGPDTLLDPEGSFRMNGVPQFLVSDASGGIVKRVPGMPDVESAAELAAALDLPYDLVP